MADKKITTVCGPIAPEALGFTSMHDHIMFNGSVLGKRLRSAMPPHQLPIHEDDKVSLENVGMLQRNTILAWDALNQDDEAVMTEEVALFKKAGGDAILELSVPGILLDMEANRRISEATGVHVVVSTGFYTSDSWPKQYQDYTVADFREHMLREIEHGVAGTSVKPGHVKIGLQALLPEEERALRAAAQVARERGLSLTVHPCRAAGSGYPRIVQIVREEGLDPARFVMAHTSVVDVPDFKVAIRHPELYRVNLERALALLDAGCNVSLEFLNVMGLELIGEYDCGDWAKMSGLVQLIERGYCDQIVLGNDNCAKIHLHSSGGEGFCRMLYYTIPTLRDVAGVSDYAIRKITRENPARILAHN